MDSRQIDLYYVLHARLVDLLRTFKDLAAKRPDAPINVFKLTAVNELIIGLNSIMDDDLRPIAGLSQFESDNMPTYSDVYMLASQYLAMLAQNTERHTYKRINDVYWLVEGAKSDRAVRQ